MRGVLPEFYKGDASRKAAREDGTGMKRGEKGGRRRSEGAAGRKEEE